MPTPRIVEVLVRWEQKKRRERIRKRLRVRLRTPLLLMTFVAAACTFFSLFGRRISKFVLNEFEYLMARGGTDPATLFMAMVFTPIIVLLEAAVVRFVYHPETETSFYQIRNCFHHGYAIANRRILSCPTVARQRADPPSELASSSFSLCHTHWMGFSTVSTSGLALFRALAASLNRRLQGRIKPPFAIRFIRSKTESPYNASLRRNSTKND